MADRQMASKFPESWDSGQKDNGKKRDFRIHLSANGGLSTRRRVSSHELLQLAVPLGWVCNVLQYSDSRIFEKRKFSKVQEQMTNSRNWRILHRSASLDRHMIQRQCDRCSSRISTCWKRKEERIVKISGGITRENVKL